MDTGSSNLAIAGAPHEELESFYVHQSSSSYVDLGKDVEMVYTQASRTLRQLQMFTRNAAFFVA